MKFVVSHKLDEEQEARLERRLERLNEFDETLNDIAKTIQRAWMVSLIGTGALAFGIGFTVGKLTK